jgi:nitronate monooxygenase
VTRFTERFGVQVPIVQAGMGGGIARHELAAAVSDAGGLGTIGILPPRAMQDELAYARALTGRAIALNILLPFARRRHWDLATFADIVVTFWGKPRRRTSTHWIHQCGSVSEAREAHQYGADGVIAQGVEAGGHVRGSEPALELLEEVRAAVPDDFPVLVAGGIATRADVTRVLDAGADGAVLGTRFLMTDESAAHPEYKLRLLGARETVLTELFGAGWPRAPHRVIHNEATHRWLKRKARGPLTIRALNLATAPIARRLPASRQERLTNRQRPDDRLLTPSPPSVGQPDTLVQAGPLYAGETVARIDDILPAAHVVRELIP